METDWSRVPVPAADAGASASFAEPGNEAGSKYAMDSSQLRMYTLNADLGIRWHVD